MHWYGCPQLPGERRQQAAAGRLALKLCWFWAAQQLATRLAGAHLALLGKGLHAQQHKAERQALRQEQEQRAVESSARAQLHAVMAES